VCGLNRLWIEILRRLSLFGDTTRRTAEKPCNNVESTCTAPLRLRDAFRLNKFLVCTPSHVKYHHMMQITSPNLYSRQRQSRGQRFTGVCLFVCLSVRTISQPPVQLGSLNLTQKCSTMSLGKPFILGSKDRSKVKITRDKKQCRRVFLHSCE